MKANFEEFVTSTTKEFLSTLETMHNVIQANALLSGRSTSYNYFLQDNGNTQVMIGVSRPRMYESCSCAVSPECVQQASVYESVFGDKITFNISGMYIGCYATEALLKSNLNCLYNRTCLDLSQFYMTTTAAINVATLDPSLPSGFSVESTVEELVNQLMVDAWNSTTDFERYHYICAPESCRFMYVARNDVIYVVTTLFSLIGGLMTVLKWMIPPSVKFSMYVIDGYHHRREVIPMT